MYAVHMRSRESSTAKVLASPSVLQRLVPVLARESHQDAALMASHVSLRRVWLKVRSMKLTSATPVVVTCAGGG